MISAALRELEARVRGQVRFDEALAGYTTYRIGGPAAALLLPESADDVVSCLQFAAETGTRWLVLGLGSNVLISDRGFDGIVIRVGRGLDRAAAGVGGEEAVWEVGAGLPTPILARRTAKAGLGGVHRLIGVPGTVGGGVFMNAGAHGQDFSQVVRTVDLLEADGTLRHVPADEIAWRYRGTGLDGKVIIAATIELTPGDPKQLLKEIRQHFRWRQAGTPFNEACCGSVFRNPATAAPPGGDGGAGAEGAEMRTAGQLIDAAGFKGFRIGGAQVSPKHANYIVNTGDATASDVLAVIDAVLERVSKEFGVELEVEVRIID